MITPRRRIRARADPERGGSAHKEFLDSDTVTMMRAVQRNPLPILGSKALVFLDGRSYLVAKMGREQAKAPGTGGRRAVAASIEPCENIDAANLHLGRFFVRNLLDVAREFDGDLQLAIPVGEIGHHSVCQHYACGSLTIRRSGCGARSPGFWNHLEPCNANSLAAAIGIPQETVHRTRRSFGSRATAISRARRPWWMPSSPPCKRRTPRHRG